MTENRLVNSKSAYLRSASHQPIDWHEFGEEAFQKAQDNDKLILLDIGAVWCHWCHVIDRESYENTEIAALINADYIAVKVDRDERPDIDARYQQVVQAMTGQGGWPLTAFLTPDGRLLYGGTYFPPQAMKKILEQLKTVYQAQKADIQKDALTEISVAEYKARLNAAEAEETQYPIPEKVFEAALDNCWQVYDKTHGGFGQAPKFPHWSTLQYLIQQAFHSQDTDLKALLSNTLTQMAEGGIYDQLAGGFHRYSVDAKWHVPHFEKMAYDNAEALLVYAQAYRLLEDPLFLETATGIWQFTQDVLSSREGGFYASQDADIDLEDDGDYFTWTLGEIQAVLSIEEADLIARYYSMTTAGDMHDRPGRNVLHINHSVEVPTKTTKNKLLAHRQTRQAPFIDTTLYLNWNSMYIAACLEAADLLNLKEAGSFAQQTLDKLLITHTDKLTKQLFHTPGVSGMLEDYAWFIQALLKAYQSTEETQYLEAAVEWASIACQKFEDTSFGGFWDTEEPTEKTIGLLKFRRKPTDDAPSSSANGIIVQNLVSLYHMTGNPLYAEKARKALGSFGQVFTARGLFSSALMIALFNERKPPLKLEVCGQNPELIQMAKQTFYPGKALVYQPAEAQAEVRLCVGTHCLQPAKSPEELALQLKEVAKMGLVPVK